MKPVHFAIIMLKITSLMFFVGIAFDLTYFPQYMANLYYTKTARSHAYYQMEANMLLVRIVINFVGGLLFFGGARPIANILVRGIRVEEN